MPGKSPSKSRRFVQDSIKFCQFWNEANKINDNSAWETFVYRCWAEFSPHNIDMLNETQDGWKTWDNEQVQVFLAEKAYTKASLLRKKFEKEGKDINLPKGYLSRKGKAPSKRVSVKDLVSLFD
mgnify:FL=1|tara:strand:+ start:1609 stop:1980 length:372 start_codon:yes stop_codon:yes gene_type:complete